MMGCELPTTTITVLHVASAPENAEDFDPDLRIEGDSGVPAHFGVSKSSAGGRVTFGVAGRTVEAEFNLITDSCDIRAGDRVRDDSTGEIFDIGQPVRRPWPLDYIKSPAARVSGA